MLDFFQKEKGKCEKQRWRETGRPGLPSQWFPSETTQRGPREDHVCSFCSVSRGPSEVFTKGGTQRLICPLTLAHIFFQPTQYDQKLPQSEQFRIKPRLFKKTCSGCACVRVCGVTDPLVQIKIRLLPLQHLEETNEAERTNVLTARRGAEGRVDYLGAWRELGGLYSGDLPPDF